MNKQKLPSSWQLGDKIQVVFPGNGILQGKIIKVAFTEYGETRYDVEIPFTHDDEGRNPGSTGFFRIHSVDQYFLSYTQDDWNKMKVDESRQIKSLWTNAFDAPPRDGVTVVCRMGTIEGYRYNSMTREKKHVFIGDEDFMLLVNNPALRDYEWLNESGFTGSTEHEESLLPTLGNLLKPEQ